MNPPAPASDGEAMALARMLDDAAAYQCGAHYRDLLRFVARLRRWKRIVKADARPLVVLKPFGPVAFVYDVLDTEALAGAPELPRDAFAFPAAGEVGEPMLKAIVAAVERGGIQIVEVDAGDGRGGSIEAAAGRYTLRVNRNHPRATRFATIAHELGHLYLGHLGADPKRRIPDRRGVPEDRAEVEAESVAWLVAARHGVALACDAYLSGFLAAGEPITLDVERVMRAAGAVERVMGLDGGRRERAGRAGMGRNGPGIGRNGTGMGREARL